MIAAVGTTEIPPNPNRKQPENSLSRFQVQLRLFNNERLSGSFGDNNYYENFVFTIFAALTICCCLKLGRVNLIVGKNTVGKSSVLDAIRIYASNGQPEVLWEIVKARDEHRQAKRTAQALLSLFRERGDVNDPIELGPLDDRLLITTQFRREVRNNEGAVRYEVVEHPEGESLIDLRMDLIVKAESSQHSLPLTRDFESYLRRDIAFRRQGLHTEWWT